jgi:glycosyltransferase involved in cell wall biosynthesis
MLPYFLEHYSQFADRIFIIDDHSTDLTAEIAKAHPMVSYSEYKFNGLNEAEFSATLELMAKKNPSDWAVCVDGDEFITGLETLKDEPSGVLKTTGYMMIGKTGKLEDCKKVRMRSFDKPVVFDPKLDVRFGDGRHSVNLPARDSQLELLHYKYPSREYYLKRNLETYPRIMDEKQMVYRINRGLDWYDKHV